MDFTVKSNKKDYFNCSMYYMKRYFGLREIILMSILLAAGLILFFLAKLILILILFGVTVLILALTTVLFVWTSVSGYKHDLIKQGIAAQNIHFDEKAMTAVYLDAAGEQILTETHDYNKIEAIAVKKNFIYIYAGIAIFYYFKRDKIGDEDFQKLADYLHTYVPAEKFKFKTVKRIYPKKKKIVIDGGEYLSDEQKAQMKESSKKAENQDE